MCHKVNPKASASRNGEKPGDLPSDIWMFPKIRGKPPKLDGENNGKPYFLMDDLGGKPTIFGNIHISENDGPFEISGWSHGKKTPDRSDGKKLLKKYVLRKSWCWLKLGARNVSCHVDVFFSELMEFFAPIPRKSPNIFGKDFRLEDDRFFHLLDGVFGPGVWAFQTGIQSNSPIPIPNKPKESPVHHWFAISFLPGKLTNVM